MSDLIDRDGLLKPMTEFREFLLEKEYYEPSIDTWALLRGAVEIFIKHIEEQPTVTQTNAEINAESALIDGMTHTTQNNDSNALNALDCIARQAVLDTLIDMPCKVDVDEDESVWILRIDAWKRIDALPPAQPEIVRCKDCKYCEHWYRDKGRCFLWCETGIDVFEDGFCNYAGRRTDG